MCNVIEVDGGLLFVDEMYQHNPEGVLDDSSGGEKIFKWSADQIAEAVKPAVSILNTIRTANMELMPDEMEASMQFELTLNGETPVFKVVSAEATAQIAVKFVWKKGKD